MSPQRMVVQWQCLLLLALLKSVEHLKAMLVWQVLDVTACLLWPPVYLCAIGREPEGYAVATKIEGMPRVPNVGGREFS